MAGFAIVPFLLFIGFDRGRSARGFFVVDLNAINQAVARRVASGADPPEVSAGEREGFGGPEAEGGGDDRGTRAE